ncbi:MAG: peptidylprolyl isomerase [Gammaproteobacteria bacterium]|nr:peptidylprolyl isomerase [Gammaproteobacteria bacterium]
MNSTLSTIRVSRLLPAVLAVAMTAGFTLPANAETVKTVNGTAIDSSVLNFYIRSRTNRPAAEATDEQRATLLDELSDIYLLTTQKVADEIRKDPTVAAQLELQQRGVIAQAIATRFFTNTTISDEEISAEYAEQQALAPPLQFKARHILVATQGEANDLVGRLKDGADFAELAKSSSTGPSGPNGGDLGWFSPNQMVKPFSDAVATLEDGAYTTTPVQTQFGWHVILREESREAEAPPLDTVKNEIRQVLQQRKFQEYLEGLRASEESGD